MPETINRVLIMKQQPQVNRRCFNTDCSWSVQGYCIIGAEGRPQPYCPKIVISQDNNTELDMIGGLE